MICLPDSLGLKGPIWHLPLELFSEMGFTAVVVSSFAKLEQLGSSRMKKPQLRKYLIRPAYRQGYETFSWLIIDVGGFSSWWAVPVLGRWSLVVQENRTEQAMGSKQCSSMLS